MRLLVLEEENGTARLRESRESFDIAELRLCYTCPRCQTEFVFRANSSDPAVEWKTQACPVCGKELKPSKADASLSKTALWEALELYREFYKFVAKQHLTDLRMLVIRPGADADTKPSDLQTPSDPEVLA